MARYRIGMLCLGLLLAACSSAPRPPGAVEIANYNPNTDYFPDKCSVRYAQQFRVEYHRNFKLVDFHSIATEETKRYVLVQRGTPAPAADPKALRIDVPLRRFAITDWRYGTAIEAFGVEDRLLGVGNGRVVTTDKIQARINRGLIKELNPDSGVNLEEAVAARLDAVFTYYSSVSQGNIHGKLEEARLAAVPLADDQERSPLARSEWIKFFALFFNKEAEAERWFTSSAAAYESLSARATESAARPAVLANYAQRDVWNVYGGRSAFAKLVADAGGNYLWRDEASGGLLPLTLEQVSHKALAADVWIIGPGFGRSGLQDTLRGDRRILSLPAWKKDQVYACAALTSDGRNPYWDQALWAPEVELADMVKMIHPELVPDHQFRFYQKMNTVNHARN